MNDIPTDYLPGYEKARAIDPEQADRYVAHTVIGDPLADAAAGDLAALDREDAARFIEIGMNGAADGALDTAPATLRAFFGNAEIQPEWLDYKTFPPASACSTGTHTWSWWRSWRASWSRVSPPT